MSADPAPILRLPLAFDDAGRIVTLEQDSVEEVTQSISVLLGTEAGERIDLPTYGVVDGFVPGPVDPAVITALAQQWEPRADLTVTSSGPDAAGVCSTTVEVEVLAGADDTAQFDPTAGSTP